MRDRKEWMNKATDPVLELLAEEFVANGRAIWFTLRFRAGDSGDAPGRSTIYRALEQLHEHGYVEKHPDNDSYYLITERGREYLQSG